MNRRCRIGPHIVLATFIVPLVGCDWFQPVSENLRAAASRFTCREIIIQTMTLTTEEVRDLPRVQTSAVRNAFGEDLVDDSNEAHDCQKLIKPGYPQEYDSLATIWVFKKLKNEKDYDEPVHVAGIHSNEISHAPLYIESGLNCVYLQGEPDSTSGWMAWIIPHDPDEQGKAKCRDRRPASADTSRRLPVYRVAQTPLGGRREYPIAARWLEYNGAQYIGLQCMEDYWCIVVPNIGNPEPEKIVARDGFGDTQRLSKVVEVDGKKILVPSGLVGTLKPLPVLESDDHTKFHGNPFPVKVATISIEGTDDATTINKYVNKFRLTLVNGKYEGTIVMDHPHDLNGDAIWKIGFGASADKDAIFQETKAHKDKKGTVRWQWLLSDEETWVECPMGCCGSG